VGIKNGGSGVFNGNAGDDTYVHPLVPGHFRNGFMGFRGGRVHGDNSGFGLFSRSESGTRCGGIRDKRIGGIGGAHSLSGKLIHGKLYDTGLAFLVLKRSEVHLRGISLGQGHTIPDKKKNIFGFSRQGSTHQDQGEKNCGNSPETPFLKTITHSIPP
jgi:hypothetical protein